MSNLLDKTNKRSKPLIFVDAMNIVLKYYYALRLKDSTQYPTGMLYGTLRFVKRLQREFPKADIMFLWEGYSSLRKARCSSYKANRSTPDNIIRDCYQEVQRALSFLAIIRQAYCVGLEADDLVGYYVNKYKYRKEIKVYSNDSDYWQYFRDNVTIYNSKGVCNYDKLKESLGFPPEKIWMYKALAGDSSDNIKGISRFPRELAVRLCNHCNSLTEMLCFIPKTNKDQKWITQLSYSVEQLKQNIELIKYQPNWVLKSRIVEIERYPLDVGRELLKDLLKKRGIKSWLKV